MLALHCADSECTHERAVKQEDNQTGLLATDGLLLRLEEWIYSGSYFSVNNIFTHLRFGLVSNKNKT